MSNKNDDRQQPTTGIESPQSPIPAAIPTTGPVTDWCPNCARMVEITPQRACRSCGRMLAGNRARTRLLPLNVARRDELQREYERDYRPNTSHARSMCRRKANVDEMLDRVKLGSPEHQRLEAISQDLASRLEAARPPKKEINRADLTIDQLIDRTQRMLNRMQELRGDPEQAKRIEAACNSPIISRIDRTIEEAPLDEVPASTPSIANTPAPAPEIVSPQDPLCPYCEGPLSLCAQINTDLRWLTEHHSRADVRAHLEEQAAIRARLGWDESTARDPITNGIRTYDDPTAVMMRRIKHGTY